MIDLSFQAAWQAEILPARPLILPPRHFTYPRQVDEVERGALEVLVRPLDGEPFLATCALGFRDPAVPSGVWSAPNAAQICCVSGGYAYLIDTNAPGSFSMISYRPVMQVIAAREAGLLLFVSHHRMLAWGRDGQAWESAKLSDEGISGCAVAGGTLRGMGWEMMSDREYPFELDLATGRRTL